MRNAFPDLINAKTGCFKRELVSSLDTREVRQAKTLDHRKAPKFARLVDDAAAALKSSPVLPNRIDASEIGKRSTESCWLT
jgi:hypothetical protein